MNRIVGTIGAMVVVVGLSACGTILVPGPQPVIYSLSPDANVKKSKRVVGAQITVEAPTAPRALDVDRIPVGYEANGMQFVPGARFADRIPALVQRALIEGLENSGGFKAVASEALGLRSTYAVAGDLRRFGASGGQVKIVLSVSVVQRREGRIVARKSIEGSSSVAGEDGASLAAAYERALAQVVEEAAPFIIRAVAKAQ